MTAGFYDFNFEYHKGGSSKHVMVFKHIGIKVNMYSMKINFNPDILGIKAIVLIRTNPMVTCESSLHAYICAN